MRQNANHTVLAPLVFLPEESLIFFTLNETDFWNDLPENVRNRTALFKPNLDV